MATSPKSATLPKKMDSVLKKEPMSVVENPPKKVVLVQEKSEKKPTAVEQQPEPQQTMDMEIDNEDVMGPSNQT